MFLTSPATGARLLHLDRIPSQPSSPRSKGAYKAVAIALGDQIQVQRLVLFAPFVGMDAAVAQGYVDMAAAVRTGAFDARPSWLQRMTGPGFAARDPAGAARVLAWLDAAPQALMCDELEALAGAPDLRPRLQALRCPALVCAGTHDAAIPMAWAEDAARRLSHAVLERFEGVGHAIFIEEPERAARLVARRRACAGAFELGARRSAGDDLVLARAARAPARKLRRCLPAGRDRCRLVTSCTVRARTLLAGGATNKEIASALDCVEATIEDHVTDLFRRSGARTRAGLVGRSSPRSTCRRPPSDLWRSRSRPAFDACGTERAACVARWLVAMHLEMGL